VADLAVSASTVTIAIILGVLAGVAAGLFGIGGGLLFVPTLVFLGLGQIEAQATSLLAIFPTAVVGAWSQQRYGNLPVKKALIVGVTSIVGVEVGARLATSLSEEWLRRLFAVLMFAVAIQLALRARHSSRSYPEPPR
jgi:uncharacterized membrane protein YfcA